MGGFGTEIQPSLDRKNTFIMNSQLHLLPPINVETDFVSTVTWLKHWKNGGGGRGYEESTLDKLHFGQSHNYFVLVTSTKLLHLFLPLMGFPNLDPSSLLTYSM